MEKKKGEHGMKKPDWVKGQSFHALHYKLAKGYSININIRQHQSGKVTVYQGVSKLIGSFGDLFSGKLDLNHGFMDTLNKHLLKTKKES